MMKCIRALAIFTSAFVVGADADDDHPYYCTSDAYCEKNYPGTVCISVNNYGDVISKCTPNTSKRPACRGAQPGLCPSYQSADRGYLNAHCVFVSEENLSLSSSGSGSSRRRLKSTASSSIATSAAASTASDSAASSALSTSSSTSSNTEDSSSSATNTSNSGGDADAIYTATVDGEGVTGQFVCLDVSDCENKAADPSTCYPSACGSADSKEQCTYQGTCTYKSTAKISKRTCLCYAGFEVICAQPKFRAQGFDGEEYDGKQGAANERCTRCTNDLACQYNNTCNTDTGKCVCAAGYTGDTCTATEDSCTTRTDCGIGACQVLADGSSACYCPSCDPTCSLCDMNVNYTFDCSICQTDAATTMQSSRLLIFVSMLVALMLGNLAM